MSKFRVNRRLSMNSTCLRSKRSDRYGSSDRATQWMERLSAPPHPSRVFLRKGDKSAGRPCRRAGKVVEQLGHNAVVCVVQACSSHSNHFHRVCAGHRTTAIWLTGIIGPAVFAISFFAAGRPGFVAVGEVGPAPRSMCAREKDRFPWLRHRSTAATRVAAHESEIRDRDRYLCWILSEPRFPEKEGLARAPRPRK